MRAEEWITAKVACKGAEEARNQLPNLLEAAEKGRATIITRRGRPVAAGFLRFAVTSITVAEVLTGPLRAADEALARLTARGTMGEHARQV